MVWHELACWWEYRHGQTLVARVRKVGQYYRWLVVRQRIVGGYAKFDEVVSGKSRTVEASKRAVEKALEA